MMNEIKENKKPLYEYLYAKDSHFGFSKEQDLKILKKLHPDVKNIIIVYSVPGEIYFMLEN